MLEDLMVAQLSTKKLELDDPREELEAWISKIRKIEKEYQTKLLWTGNILNSSQLINAIKSRVIALESRSEIQTIYLGTVNKQGDKITTEYGYKIHSTSQKNVEYECIMAKVIKKDEAITLVDNFVFCFNRLKILFRIILYYSFFKRESALRISQMRLDGNLTYASRTVLRKRTEGCAQLVNMLRCVEWLKTKELDVLKNTVG